MIPILIEVKQSPNVNDNHLYSNRRLLLWCRSHSETQQVSLNVGSCNRRRSNRWSLIICQFLKKIPKPFLTIRESAPVTFRPLWPIWGEEGGGEEDTPGREANPSIGADLLASRSNILAFLEPWNLTTWNFRLRQAPWQHLPPSLVRATHGCDIFYNRYPTHPVYKVHLVSMCKAKNAFSGNWDLNRECVQGLCLAEERLPHGVGQQRLSPRGEDSRVGWGRAKTIWRCHAAHQVYDQYHQP